MSLPRRTGRATLAAAAAMFILLPLPQARAASATVEIRDSYYATKYIVVTIGDAITWVNNGAGKHTVDTFPSAPEQFSSGNADPDGNGTACDGTIVAPDNCLSSGGRFSWTFSKAGTYNYYCKVHGNTASPPNPAVAADAQPCGMCAQIVVNAPPSSPSPVKKRSPKPRASATASPSATPSASASPSPSVIFTTGGSPIAVPNGGDGGSGGRTTLAVLLILGLSGAGYATWRRFIAPR